MLTRRDVVAALGAVALGAQGVVEAAAAEVPAGAAAGGAHHHAAGDEALLDGTVSCTRTGEACVEHCFAVIESGDTSIVGCARAVHEMLAVNAALLRLAAAGPATAGPIARAAVSIYRDCETQCRKHQEKHDACRRCADSCAAVIAAIGKLPA